MSRSLDYLVRALLGLAVVGSLGFGATQAFARNEAPRFATCPAMGYPYAYAPCGYGCPGGRGYCDENGNCQCGDIP